MSSSVDDWILGAAGDGMHEPEGEGSMFEHAARSVMALYGGFVKGRPDSSLLIVSEHRLPSDASEALKASADRLGYGRNGCAWVVLREPGADDASAARLGESDLRTIVEGVDPIAVIATDGTSARALCDAYGARASVDSMTRMNGRRVVLLGDFPSMLADDDAKQRAWRLLKRLSLEW